MVIKGEKKMAIYENMHELIGNTPMVKLSTINKEITSEIFAKLEFYNPAGSVKDRVGKYMIADAEEKGLLKPSDYSEGNRNLRRIQKDAVERKARSYGILGG